MTLDERLERTLDLYETALERGWARTRLADLKAISDDVLRLLAETAGIDAAEIGLAR